MAIYRTPDVYVEEIQTLPPSVAEVSTAIPAFIGYTEKAENADGRNLTNVPTRINTLLEYTDQFGGAYRPTFTADTNDKNELISITLTDEKKHRMYYALDHFFKNGGGSCYIVSIGGYAQDKAKADFEKGLAAVGMEDEPTLIVLSEATTLALPKDYYDLCQAVLDQCQLLKDRFGIFDVLASDDKKATAFRGGISNNLKYGAAYYPYLETTINYQYKESEVVVTLGGASSSAAAEPTMKKYEVTHDGLKIGYQGDDTPALNVTKASPASAEIAISETDAVLTITNGGGKAPADVLAAWTTYSGTAGAVTKFSLSLNSDAPAKVSVATDKAFADVTPAPASTAGSGRSLESIKNESTGLYNTIKLEMAKQRVVLPPSPAIAGVYASVDRNRGVWKAPANVGLNAVIAPTVKISVQDQDLLNIDDNSGKSINAIRAFTGQGIYVWGARTLAGNDNEWRYISVRRLFNMIEESARKASAFAVFEPNDQTTWLKVKGMLESYLYGLWQQGALAGSKAETSYFVNVGLGKTMTTQDILEGRMIIEIGIAAVRPAEFIILRFSHKLQEA